MKVFRYLMLALMVALSISACTQDEIDNLLNNNGTTDEGGNNDGNDDANDEGNNEGNGDLDFVLDENKTYPLVSSFPEIIITDTTEDVTIILNGKGTALENFTGDVYAHTGVLTEDSTSSADWKYVKAEWKQNTPECKLAKHKNNLWTLTIKGGPYAFYNVPSTDKITALAFVFRSADGKKEVKDNGKDIFIETKEEVLGVYITYLKQQFA